MLIELGLSVIEATSVDEATALLADLEDIRLVLTDIHLQGDKTGPDLARRIGRSVPCLLMTSLPPDDPLHRAALAHGPVLRKPFSLPQLAALIRPESPR